MLQLVFDKAAIRHNISAVKKRAGKSIIYAVLTADGYGAGLVELATLLRADGISHFAVTSVADAAKLRKAGFVEEEILMLRSTGDPEELGVLMDLNVVCTIGSYETGVALNALAEQRSTVAVAHVLVDTGMGLGGFLPSEPEKLLSAFRYLSNVAISGTYTQLTAAKGDVNGQMELFQSTLDTLHKAGLETGITHAAGSYVLMRSQGVQLDAVRVGSAFLGQCRRRAGDGLKNAVHGEVTLDTVRWLPKGSTVGNYRPIRLKRPTRVAVFSAGTQNGFGLEPARRVGLLRRLLAALLPRKRAVTCNGTKTRLLGGVGLMECAIDVTDLRCAPGDVVRFDINPLYAAGMERIYR